MNTRIHRMEVTGEPQGTIDPTFSALVGDGWITGPSWMGEDDEDGEKRHFLFIVLYRPPETVLLPAQPSPPINVSAPNLGPDGWLRVVLIALLFTLVLLALFAQAFT